MEGDEVKNPFLLALALVVLGCGGGAGGGTLAAGDLSEEECRKLLQKISDVSYANLSPAEMAEVASIETPEKKEQDVKECVAEQNWTRSAYDCAMQATSESDLKSCIMGMN